MLSAALKYCTFSSFQKDTSQNWKLFLKSGHIKAAFFFSTKIEYIYFLCVFVNYATDIECTLR